MSVRHVSAAEGLVEYVEAALGVEVEPFEPTIRTCFGQTICILGEDRLWVDELQFEHIGYTTVRLPWRERFHENDLIEWMFRACLIERMQTHADVRPIFELAQLLRRLPADIEPESAASSVIAWAQDVARCTELSGRPHLAIGAKALCYWACELQLPGFQDDDIWFTRINAGRHGGSIAATLLDSESGPFSYAEMRAIEAALQRDLSWTRQRAIFYLCRDWGIRPIQLALLREEDFGDDLLGAYIRIPSVKGVRRSKARRANGNFKKRHLSDEAAKAIREHLECNAARLDRVINLVSCHGGVPSESLANIPRPLFPLGGFSERIPRCLADATLRDYALHSTSNAMSREIREMASLVNVPKGSSTRDVPQEFVNINAYRFRHTKAMSMVMAGHDPVDVAEALDHVAIGSVRHYFRFSLDLIQFVNASHMASREIGDAVSAWRGKFVAPSESVSTGEMRVAHLGICKSSAPCPHHPTVTCYTCAKFRPYRGADHEEAERAILSLKEAVDANSTGAVKIQLAAALEGVRAVIRADANEPH